MKTSLKFIVSDSDDAEDSISVKISFSAEVGQNMALLEKVNEALKAEVNESSLIKTLKELFPHNKHVVTSLESMFENWSCSITSVNKQVSYSNTDGHHFTITAEKRSIMRTTVR